MVVRALKVCSDRLHKPIVLTTINSSHDLPSHSVLSTLCLKPLLQLWHMLAPSTVHVAPDGGTPFGHKQTFASHLLLSPLTFHPVLQPDTTHPDEYDSA